MQEKITTPISIIISGVIISLGLYAGSYNIKPSEEIEVKQNPIVENAPVIPSKISVSPISDGDYILGSKDADVIVFGYADLECPFCKKFHDTLKKIMIEYGEGGKVAWVFRHYPIDQLHSKARKEAEAAECAGDQGGNGAFWAYIDKLYSITPSNNKLDLAQLPEIAKELKLNMSEFNDCLTKGKFSDKIEQEVSKAMQAGAKGTPYTVIMAKGEVMLVKGGAVSYESLKALIDEALKK